MITKLVHENRTRACAGPARLKAGGTNEKHRFCFANLDNFGP
jgi:hypothetical protein